MEFSKNNDNSDFSNNYNLIIAEIDNLLKKYLKINLYLKSGILSKKLVF